MSILESDQMLTESELIKDEIFERNIHSAIEIVKTEAKDKKEQMEIYIKLLKPIYDVLPKEEQELFLKNPINFTSKKLFFRGVGKDKLNELFETKQMNPTHGDYSNAVFLSDAPAATVSYLNKPGGAMIVIDSGLANYSSPDKSLLIPGTKEYKKLSAKYRNSFKTDEEKREAPYTFDNNHDMKTSYTTYEHLPWSTIHLRKPQPLSAVKQIITLNPDSSYKSINPHIFQNDENLIIK